MNFINILYVWQHDVSLGDSLTNFHSHLCIIKQKHPNSIIYTIVHPRTYNTSVVNVFLKKGLIDFVYPFYIKNINIDENYDYKCILERTKFELVIHNQHSEKDVVDITKKMYPNSLHLQTFESAYGLLNILEYCQINHTDFLKTIKDGYHIDYINEFVKNILSISNKKKVCIFSGSTRPLANIGYEGLQKIINITSSLNFHNFLVGTSIFNLYDKHGQNWNSIYEKSYVNTTNLIGNNWYKTLEVMKKCDIIISGPTGAAMISPVINKKQILILGGDSPIMDDCINVYTNQQYTNKLPCKCVNYPCGLNNLKIDLIKYNKCFNEKHPICLNEEINVEDLTELLKNA